MTARTVDGPQKHLLSQRFHHAIDRAAGVAGLTDKDSYVAQWRRSTVKVEGDVAVAAQAEAERLEHAHPREVLQAIVENGGLAPATGGAELEPTRLDAHGTAEGGDVRA